MFNKARKVLTYILTHELALLLAGLAIAAGVWGFIELADEVMEGDTNAADEFLLLMFRTNNDPGNPLGGATTAYWMKDLTSLGGIPLVTLLTCVSALFLALTRRWFLLAMTLVAVIGGGLMIRFLKDFFERERPDAAFQLMAETSQSFPSGHATMSAVVYFTLAVLLAQTQKQWNLKVFFVVVAAVLTVTVGVTRVFMGMHYPTDVLAGWIIGGVWATFIWLASKLIYKMWGHTPEEPGEPRE